MSRVSRNQEINDKIMQRKSGSWKYWLISLAVNLVILAVVLHLTPIYYETNDDYSIAYKIATEYPYVGFVNYYLCMALIPIQKVFSSVNIFILSQMIMSVTAFTAVLKVFFERRSEFFYCALAAGIAFFFSFDHYSSVQFTKTSALLMAAGLVYIADAYIHSEPVISFLGGYLLYFIGVCYRQMGMFPALSYIGVFMLIWWMFNGRRFFKGKNPFKETALVLLILALLVIPYGFDKMSDRMNASTPELAYGREYQAERVKITDYPVLDRYENFADEYEAAGFSRNDIYIIDRFILDYDGAASLENLKTINRIDSPTASTKATVIKAVKKFLKNTLKSLRDMNFTGRHIVILAMLALAAAIAGKKRDWAYILAAGALTVALYIAIYYMQRTMYRAFYVADISAALWLLYVMAVEARIPGEESAGHSWIRRICFSLVIAMLILLTPGAIRGLEAGSARALSYTEPAEITEYLDSHPEIFYVVPTSRQKYPAQYADPLSVPTMPENRTNTGGWETLTPARMDFLKSHGVSNPIKDLIDNPDMLFFGEYKFDQLSEYYNKWYAAEGKRIIFEEVDNINETGIYRIISVDL